MIQFFLILYNFFEKHKILFYGLLAISSVLICCYASRIRLVEDINSFMPKTDNTEKIGEVFKNLKIKDKIIILVSRTDTGKSNDPADLIRVCDAFLDSLQTSKTGKTHIKSIQSKIDDRTIDQMYRYITDNLPVFLDSTDYTRLDTLLLNEKNLEKRIEQNYTMLLSPLSLVSKKITAADPLGLTGKSFKKTESLQPDLKYELYDDHIFSSDLQILTAFITPEFGAAEISENEDFVRETESLIREFEQKYPDVTISWFGGIPISVYNARQIKSDSMITMIIALGLISVVVLFAFKRKSAIPMIILPVIFGGGFSVALISIIQGSISTIAIGAGSVILGVALSYSIHVFCHSIHSKSAEQVIRELAYPMTIGSFTTIGGFIGLTFCNSEILNDLGLFACFALIGTTLFCLIFMPHFLTFKPVKESRLMKKIEQFNAYPFEKNKLLLIITAVITCICLFFFNDVKFNGDMMQLSYMPKKFAVAEKTINETFKGENESVWFISTGEDLNKTLDNYKETADILEKLKKEGTISGYSSAHDLLISPHEQQIRIDKWNKYWTTEKKEKLKNDLIRIGEKYSFKPTSFSAFFEILDKNYTVTDYLSESFADKTIMSDRLAGSEKLKMAITQVSLSEQNKEKVYKAFDHSTNVVIADKPYFASKMAEVVNDDFNTILYIVSILVFLSIFISYGRIEITLITFMPMALAWIIILGIMSIAGIQFNIISIIISTFIFGIGDDFSIFITDGLITEYKTGKKMLNAHKTSIFFSAFTVIAGLGAMMFSKHPALYSVSVTSIVGMIAVVMVAYTLQPFIFRLFISGRTTGGKFPHTWYSLLTTSVTLGIFISGSIIMTFVSYLFVLIPVSKKRKQSIFNKMLHYFCRFLLAAAINEKKVTENPTGEDFSKPAIIIANHQSVIDILRMWALHDKIIMVTKSWVTNAFLIGRIVKYAGFVDITNGYDGIEDQIADKIKDGYSVGIFPEGSRSTTGEIKRFHKGAFYLAEKMKLDIIPVIFHGNGQAMSKNDLFYLKDATLAAKILPRISFEKLSEFGTTYREITKSISRMFKKEHVSFSEKIDNTCNPYFKYKLVKNYTYKDPVLEWYMRIKTALEKDYKRFEQLIPRTGVITDIGCGYGFLCYMLAFRSNGRKITGIDYDEDKIKVADHNFSKTDRMKFFTADASEFEFDHSDVFILNDILHYLPKEKQDKILTRCVQKLNEKGKIIIRDGDRENKQKHTFTKISEIFSTQIMMFNKKEYDLCFISTEEIKQFGEQYNLSVSVTKNDNYSSNTLYILEKRQSS